MFHWNPTDFLNGPKVKWKSESMFLVGGVFTKQTIFSYFNELLSVEVLFWSTS